MSHEISRNCSSSIPNHQPSITPQHPTAAQAFYFLSFHGEVTLKLRAFRKAWVLARTLSSSEVSARITWTRTKSVVISDAAEKRPWDAAFFGAQNLGFPWGYPNGWMVCMGKSHESYENGWWFRDTPMYGTPQIGNWEAGWLQDQNHESTYQEWCTWNILELCQKNGLPYEHPRFAVVIFWWLGIPKCLETPAFNVKSFIVLFGRVGACEKAHDD